MTTTERVAVVLAADAVDRERRTIRGRVIPYGEVGHPNVGAMWVRGPGRLRLPADLTHFVLLLGHDSPRRPVGVAISADDTAEGLDVTFRVAETPDGDLALAEADPASPAPVRTGMSIELDNCSYEPDGGLASADALAVALVPVPAFDTARVAAVVAARHTPEEGTPTVDPENPAPVTPPAPAVVAPVAAPAGLPFVADPASPVTTEARPQVLAAAAGVPDLRALLTAAAAHHRGERSPEVMAALSAATFAANPYVAPDAYAGELWSGNSYVRRWVNLYATAALTHWKVKGWRWVTKPRVQRYNPASGSSTTMAEIPTNTVSTEPVEETAVRFAGGHKIDRKFADFGDTEFLASFLAAKTESYAEETDAYAREELLSFITEVMDAEGAATAAMPAGFGTVAAPTTLLKAGALASAVLRETPNVRSAPQFMLVNTLDWLALADVLDKDVPAFLAMLGVTPGDLIPDLEVPRGTLVAGVKQAQTFRELPGAAPVRVSAADLSHAAADDALFGYAHAMNNRPGGVISVPFGALLDDGA